MPEFLIMKISLVKSFIRVALAVTLLAGFSMGSASGALEPPSEFTVAKDGDNLNVGFGTVPGQTYTVEKSTTLAPGNWTEILSNVTGNGTVQTATDAGAGTLPKCFYRIRYGVAPSSTGFALIPAGSFQMGDDLWESDDGTGAEVPVHSVNVSAFYMDKYEVSKALWDEVAIWAEANGYDINASSASGKAANHPVQTVDWRACVKWCNARSNKDGLTPCYTVSGATYKTGISTPVCNFAASGYRLPTEAEWEKAARGGLSGKRFPWGDTISQSQANYYVYSSDGTTNYYSYDVSPTRGLHPTYSNGVWPYTSPVGSFAPNGYGLYDMAGNLWEWCNDWYSGGYYSSSPVSNPRGPSSGSGRVIRGGGCHYSANSCRAAYRNYGSPDILNESLGFRCVRSSVP